jgi:hypothetical protein
MSKIQTTAKARVTLIVEVEVRGTWGDDCTVAQVHKQAAEEACGAIRNAADRHDIKIIGEQKVDMITTTRESK